MTQKHDYKKAIEVAENGKEHCQCFCDYPEELETILHALKLADKVTGEPNSSMVKSGESESLRLYYDTMRNDNLHTRAACAFNVFKAMIQTAQKEIADENNSA
jgi:hypothetical protein